MHETLISLQRPFRKIFTALDAPRLYRNASSACTNVVLDTDFRIKYCLQRRQCKLPSGTPSLRKCVQVQQQFQVVNYIIILYAPLREVEAGPLMRTGNLCEPNAP